MIGLVIVSHSRALAEALVDLVRQVSQQDVPIAIAAGIGPGREEFGTDAVEISEAIASVSSPDGVLVLMDLGSAVISAEMAVELLPEEGRRRVRFCAAPLVEGTIAAVVQAGLGSDLDTVCREAAGALLPKLEHFGGPQPASASAPMPVSAAAVAEEICSVTLVLHNQHGLHARPAARFVQTSATYDATIQVTNLTSGKGPVSARSLNALATLGAVRGDQILVLASGPQARAALDALQRLVIGNFGEQGPEPAGPPAAPPVLQAAGAVSELLPSNPQALPPLPQAEVADPLSQGEGVFQAVPLSEGTALGRFFRYQPALPPIPVEKTGDPDGEWKRLQRALETVRGSIQARLQQMKIALGEADAAIFEAHLLILDDPDLLAGVRQGIYADKENAAAAWNRGIQQVAALYQDLDDPYLRQRASDVLDVGSQVLFALADKVASVPVKFPEPVVLFAQELTPTETSQLDLSQVLALVLVGGGPTSHSAILARAMGIPAISGANPAIEWLAPGTLLGVDGFRGLVWVDPSPAAQEALLSRRESWLAERQRLLQAGRQPASTRDGERVEVAANVGSVLDAKAALENGAEAIGLLRTEFLYLTRSTPPTEAEQVDSLRQIGEVMGVKPVIVRTLDVGGDKELPYIDIPPEANPFMGVRALRLSLRNPQLFLTQLRAVLRAGHDFNFRIMFPMVANLDELLQARRWLEEAHRSLEAEYLPHCWPIELGIMVEIPSAAILSETLAPHIDFFSIGTNDLTQYTLAAERGNPSLAGLQDAFHPAVLRLIEQVTASAKKHGKWVGVCGELAGDPLAAPVLVGLGVKELSLNPSGIPRVKEALRSIDSGQAREAAAKILATDSPASARRLAQELFTLSP
jgi:phosphocarrier protein FPr